MAEALPQVEWNMIEVVGLKKYFPIRGGLFKRAIGAVKAVDDVTFYIKKGETLGLVGESGCGKTTVGRSIMMLTPPTGGYVFIETPRETVQAFKTLYEVTKNIKHGKMTALDAMHIADAANVLYGRECGVSEEHRRHLCEDADKIKKMASKLRPTDKVKQEEAVWEFVKEAMEEVARKYCINFRRKGQVKRLRSRMQFVFQDPFSSLDPKMLIKDIVSEPMVAQNRYRKKRLSREEIRNQSIKLLERVGLNVEHMYRFPHEFSGGQRQRIGVARALSVNPDFVVLDEPTSALDVSVQAQILNQLNALQRDLGLTYLFISHDLSVVRYMCDRVAVMYLGKIAEYATKDEIFARPTHPYTEALLSVIPVPDPDLKRDRIILPGDVPSPANPPTGCRFHTRCPLVIDICHVVDPPLTDRGNEHYVACHVR